MKAVIFAAGKGVRMLPLTASAPKPMLPVLGRPILEHTLRALPKEITEIILVVGYKGDMIRAHFGSEWEGRKIVYEEQKELRGTWDALLLAKAQVEGEKKFLVMGGDDLFRKEDLERLAAHSRAILVCEVADPSRFGVVVLDPSGRVLDIEEAPERPKSNIVNTGAYVLTPDFFKYPPRLSARGEYLLTDGLQDFVREYDVHAEMASFWVPVGYPDDLEKAAQLMRKLGNPAA